jgi:hypothetical protein
MQASDAFEACGLDTQHQDHNGVTKKIFKAIKSIVSAAKWAKINRQMRSFASYYKVHIGSQALETTKCFSNVSCAAASSAAASQDLSLVQGCK